MVESLITISIVGLIAGFIFSVPVAGPISIFITSKSLKGDHRYCALAAIGASVVDFIYCFVAVYSFTRLYELYRPIIHYIFLFGSVFLFIVGIKIIKTKLSLNQIKDKNQTQNKKKGGFWTGFMINFFNPSLFVGWMLSSFLIMSFVSSLGFNTGGLENVLDNNIKAMNHIEEKHAPENKKNDVPVIKKIDKDILKKNKEFDDYKKSSIFPVLLSLCYAIFVALGTIIWFYYFSLLIVKYRYKLKVATINKIIQVLGIGLCFFGLYLAYKAFNVLII